MTAYNVIAENLEVGHRIGFGVLGENQIAIGLEGRGPNCVLLDAEKTGEHALRLILDGALEKDVR